MRDLGPAFRRIMRYEQMAHVLQNRIESERWTIRTAGMREAERSLRKAGIKPGVTLIGDSRGREIGVYERVRIEWGPRSDGSHWHIQVHYRSLLKTGKIGALRAYVGVYVDHPRDLASKLAILGTVAGK